MICKYTLDAYNDMYMYFTSFDIKKQLALKHTM